jgi:hypothetical protein
MFIKGRRNPVRDSDRMLGSEQHPGAAQPLPPCRVWPSSEADDVRDRMGSRDVFLVGIRVRCRAPSEAAAIRRMLCFALGSAACARQFAHVTLACSLLLISAHPLLANGHVSSLKPANAMLSCVGGTFILPCYTLVI